MGIKELGIWGMIFLWTAGLAAQSDLVALQKKEKERRKKMKASVLVLNDETLMDQVREKGMPVTTGGDQELTEGGQPVPSENNAPTPPVVDNPEADRSYWVGLRRSHNETLEQQKVKIRDLELQIERTIISRASESNPVRYNEMAEEIIQLEASKEEEKNRLAEIEREWENVVKDAREKGVPANWLSD